jgi:predicted exporter
MLYQPTSALTTRLLEQDPLLLFPALAQEWGHRTTSLALHDGLLTQRYNGRVYHVITAQIAFHPFEAYGQTQFEDQWAHWTRTLQQSWPGLELTSTSLLRFATATRKTIHSDMALISCGSILGVALLTFGTFRTLKHLCLALIPIAAGIWSGLGIALLFFGELHALTLVQHQLLFDG